MEKKRFLVSVLAFIMLLGLVLAEGADFVQTFDKVNFYVVDDNTLPLEENNSVDLAIATGSDDWKRVWFRLDLGGSKYLTKGTLTFSRADGNLWNSGTIKWGNNSITFNTAGDNDNVAPVPIPATVWLLGSGLFGLVAVRRRRNNIS